MGVHDAILELPDAELVPGSAVSHQAHQASQEGHDVHACSACMIGTALGDIPACQGDRRVFDSAGSWSFLGVDVYDAILELPDAELVPGSAVSQQASQESHDVHACCMLDMYDWNSSAKHTSLPGRCVFNSTGSWSFLGVDVHDAILELPDAELVPGSAVSHQASQESHDVHACCAPTFHW